MKVWLDDVRTSPKGWTWVKTPKEAATLVEENDVDEVSLDHDLGFCIFTGYDFLLWLEKKVVLHNFKPPAKIHVHTSNPSARVKMELAVKKIKELWEEKTK